jgi:hypothetical protein
MKNNNLEIIAVEEVLRKSLTSAPDGRPLARRVYFGPDSWQLDEEFLPLVSAHASYLSANPGLIAVVAGHCQGTQRQRRCWLIGERRSRSVVHALIAAGVKPDQIAGISKGVMKPSVECNDKSAIYRRRVNIEYVAANELQEKIALVPGAPSWWKANTIAKRAGLLKKSTAKTRATSRSTRQTVCETTEHAWLS